MPVSKSSSLSCLNRMIAAGLKSPSVRGAVEESDRDKEGGYHVWEVPNKTTLINLFNTRQLSHRLSVCSRSLCIRLRPACRHIITSQCVQFAGTFDEVKEKLPDPWCPFIFAFCLSSSGVQGQVKDRVKGEHVARHWLLLSFNNMM